MCSRSTPGADSAGDPLTVTAPARAAYVRVCEHEPMSIVDHLAAESLCIEITEPMRAAAAAATTTEDARRWAWSADQTRDRGERHALWAHLIAAVDEAGTAGGAV